MPKQYFFSINLLIKDKSNIDDTVASVISDEKFFLENVQLIFIDSVCSEESIQSCSQYIEQFPENIIFVDTSGKNSPASYNDAYSLCSGKYISFIDNIFFKEVTPKHKDKFIGSIFKGYHACGNGIDIRHIGRKR